jgi:fructosamine-3-kinase
MNSARSAAIAAVIGQALGSSVRVERVMGLSGGSISDVTRVDTTAGVFVVKSHPNAPDGLFQAEADGLAALRASGTSLAIPRVIAATTGQPSFLVIEYLGAGRSGGGFDERLGVGLAELHRATTSRFGFHADNFCGATPQPNPWTGRWIDFYRESRLGHQLRLAVDAGHVSPADSSRIERLMQRLDDWIDEPASGPSLIHGDLWSGNLHVTDDGQPALIDPAVSYSHREAELGMMRLFGGFSARVFAAYEAAWPLPPGWRDRNGLYELYHLMNHLNLFGAGYHSQLMAMVGRYV